MIVMHRENRGNSVSILTRLRPELTGFDSWQVLGLFSLRNRVQTGSGAHETPIQWVLGVLSPELKR
jgi:hypothetical protein